MNKAIRHKSQIIDDDSEFRYPIFNQEFRNYKH
jgi:hypothetical protein